MYLLRRHLGISWQQAQDELPAWEVDALLAELIADLNRGATHG